MRYEITVEITDDAIISAFRNGGLDITKSQLAAAMRTKKFKDAIAGDMVELFCMSGESGSSSADMLDIYGEFFPG